MKGTCVAQIPSDGSADAARLEGLRLEWVPYGPFSGLVPTAIAELLTIVGTTIAGQAAIVEARARLGAVPSWLLRGV